MGFPLSTDPRGGGLGKYTAPARLRPTAEVKPYAADSAALPMPVKKAAPTPKITPAAPIPAPLINKPMIVPPGQNKPIVPPPIAAAIAAPKGITPAPRAIMPPARPMVSAAPQAAQPMAPMAAPQMPVRPSIPQLAGGPVRPEELASLFSKAPMRRGLADGGTVASAAPSDPWSIFGSSPSPYDLTGGFPGSSAAGAGSSIMPYLTAPDGTNISPGAGSASSSGTSSTSGMATPPGGYTATSGGFNAPPTNGGSGAFNPTEIGGGSGPNGSFTAADLAALSNGGSSSSTAPGNGVGNSFVPGTNGSSGGLMTPSAAGATSTDKSFPSGSYAAPNGLSGSALTAAEESYLNDPNNKDVLAYYNQNKANLGGETADQFALQHFDQYGQKEGRTFQSGAGYTPGGGVGVTMGGSTGSTASTPSVSATPNGGLTQDQVKQLIQEFYASQNANSTLNAGPITNADGSVTTSQGPAQSAATVLSSLTPNRTNRFASDYFAPNFSG